MSHQNRYLRSKRLRSASGMPPTANANFAGATCLQTGTQTTSNGGQKLAEPMSRKCKLYVINVIGKKQLRKTRT